MNSRGITSRNLRFRVIEIKRLLLEGLLGSFLQSSPDSQNHLRGLSEKRVEHRLLFGNNLSVRLKLGSLIF